MLRARTERAAAIAARRTACETAMVAVSSQLVAVAGCGAVEGERVLAVDHVASAGVLSEPVAAGDVDLYDRRSS